MLHTHALVLAFWITIDIVLGAGAVMTWRPRP